MSETKSMEAPPEDYYRMAEEFSSDMLTVICAKCAAVVPSGDAWEAIHTAWHETNTT